MRRSLALIALVTLSGGTLSLTPPAGAQEELPEGTVRTGAGRRGAHRRGASHAPLPRGRAHRGRHDRQRAGGRKHADHREDEFLGEGHGTYFSRVRDDAEWEEEFERIIGPMVGRAETLDRPEGEREWMIEDSFCRQHLWGSWTGGYFLEGTTELSGPDPDWPLRTSIEASCPLLFPPA